MKLKIINHVPDTNYNYPVKNMYGINRRFRVEWVKNHPWAHYSKSKDGVYCKACALFAPSDIGRQKLGVFVTRPFQVWTKQSSAFLSHEEHKYHQDSMTKMVSFRDSCSVPTHNVACMLNKEREEQIARNTMVVKSLLKCVCFCGKQGLSFRGHRDDYTATEFDNKGNFIELVQLRSETDQVLRDYLEHAPRNAVYTSKTIQNEMIDVVSSTIRNSIIKEIKNSKYFTILADEVTDCANLEQISVVIRFVDGDKQIREEFLDFITVERITGESISAALLSWLEAHELDVAFCRGQGYDGASSMSSSNMGVQGRICRVSPLALYTHCHSHQLNLCIVRACSIPQIRNANGAISEIAKFFNYSPKRQRFFEHIIDSVLPNEKRVKLKDLCRTRWVQRIDSYLVFYDLYPAIIKAMESINSSSTEFGNWSWDSETMTKANGYLFQVTSFEFLTAFSITMRILSSLRCLTVNLQKRSHDVLTAYEHVSDVQLEMELMKVNCEDEFHTWFEEIKSFAESLDISVSTPRVTSRQVHRGNVPADTPEVYYRRNIMIPFLDHITAEMKTRFGSIHQTKIKLLGLIPSTAVSYAASSIRDVGELYRSDLPSPQLLPTEFNRWKMKFTSMSSSHRPDSLQAALQCCDEDAFPNLKVLLVIACTLPITTCETERANSQLKLIKTDLRSTMAEERLAGLAMIKVHRRMVDDLDFDELIVTFANKHPRRMALPCVLSDNNSNY